MLSIVISTRNRAQSLRRTLESLGRMVPPEARWEIVVVDNASIDGTRDTVAEFAATAPAPVRCVLESRPGKSFAVNAGIAAASGDLLAFTDDDVIVDPGWGRAFSAAMQGSRFIGAGGRIVAEWTAAPPRWLAVDRPDRLMTVVAFDVGAEPGELSAAPFGPNMAFRRTAFDRYGLFRTDLGPGPGPYLPGQDTEFGRRLLRAGERLAWVPDAVVHHQHQANKITKRHIAVWYFGYGRMTVRTGMMSTNAVRYFGVPGYLLRQLLSNLRLWATCVEPKRRFRYWAEAGRVAGAITETFLSRGRS